MREKPREMAERINMFMKTAGTVVAVGTVGAAAVFLAKYVLK